MMVAAVDPVVSYVPARVARRYGAPRRARRKPLRERFPAAVFFADVSGFTPLAGRLAEQGPAGAEELGRVLNGYFATVLSAIEAHGGEAVKFCGDGLLALWTPRLGETTLAGAVRRATACGLAVQAALRDYGDNGGTELAMRVGVGAGTIWGLHVGGVGEHWYYVVAGQPIHQIITADRQSGPGDVVLSADAWQLVQPDCVGEPREDGCVRITALRGTADVENPVRSAVARRAPDRARPDALAAYLPAPVRERLAAGHLDWLAELRRVSVVFVSLLDLRADDPRALARVQEVVASSLSIFERYEGVVKELVFDDKGASLVAWFGLPRTHEDDAARAVEAARAVRAALAARGVRAGAGITTGRAFCGAVGTDWRREYALVGDVVNMAARLMSQAGAGLLCDYATARAARGRVQFDVRAPVQVKGREEPLDVYAPRAHTVSEVGAAAPRARLARPLVGRRIERQTLADALLAVQQGTSGVVLLEGEAGLGKSHLVAELLALAADAVVPALVGAADSTSQVTTYAAWRPVFSQVLGLDAGAESGGDARAARVRAALADDPALADLAPLMSPVVGVDLPDTEVTRTLSGQARAVATWDLLVRLLQRHVARTGRPLLVVLEDAHWLDSASWALARAAPARVTPLLLVLTLRPLDGPPPAAYVVLRGAPTTRRIALGALGADDLAALVRSRLGVRRLAPAVAAFIRERADGNPFFGEELALALLDAGALVIAAGTCDLAPGLTKEVLAFPDTVQGVITSRIDRLSPRQQLILKVASVVGRAFPYPTVCAVHPVEGDRPHVAAELEALDRLDLTPLETLEPEPTYQFKHAITHEVAYSLLPFAQRRELHRRVAEWYEAAHRADLASHYAALAYHWNQTDDVAKAASYATLAGDAARRLYAYPEARQHYAHALAAVDRLPDNVNARRQRVDMRLRLCEVSYTAEPLDAHRARLEEAAALARDLPAADGGPGPDGLRVGYVHFGMGRALFYGGQLRRAVEEVQAAYDLGVYFRDAALRALAGGWLGRIFILRGDYRTGYPQLMAAVDYLADAGHWPEWVSSMGALGCAVAARGDYAAGAATVERGLARARELGYQTGVVLCHGWLFVCHALAAETPRMLEVAAAGVALAERIGDHVLHELGVAMRALAESRLGQHAAAKSSLEQARALRVRLGGRSMLPELVAAYEAEIAGNAGDWQRARRLAEEARERARAAESVLAEGYAERIWGQALAALDPSGGGQAHAHLAASVAIFERGDNRLEAARGRQLLAALPTR